jgi:pimeloyl-ACP methyl ester carboxylesterase
VLGVVACCAMTDMRCGECRSTMSELHAHAVWNAPDRDSALAASLEAHGENGSRMVEMASQLAPSDAAMFADPAWLASMRADAVPAMFAHGFQGYADDRIADKPGWVTFDASAVACPVIVLHGADDRIVDPRQARHTADIVPDAELRIVDGLGHFSIMPEIVPALVDLLARSPSI